MSLFRNCSGHSLANGLKCVNEPTAWTFDNGVLCIEPDGKTDAFRKYPQPPRDGACFLYTEVEGDFTLVAKIKLEGRAFGDAGAITIRRDGRRWAKLCVERSPIGETSIVSVVTHEWSDDANNELLLSPEAYLRITKIAGLVGMHYRLAGDAWRFVRAFGVDWPSTESHRYDGPRQAAKARGCRELTGQWVLR